ncbi:MAG: KamA family radical SAM protein [Candidatus Schekmanbacteria bacterium]|nr:MAG: KamA family radical SAM protein [Candidatus Schekmanbacteria bacterium]
MERAVWKKELDESITSLSKLSKYIYIPKSDIKKIEQVIARHPMKITRYYLSLMNPDKIDDPIRKMAVASEEELHLLGSYDTSGEKENTMMQGLQHKYEKTALILATVKCANYCRYCFRKRMVGLSSDEVLKKFSEAVNYIKAHKEINNVLISGGDPLTLPTNIIKHFLEKISTIPHIDFIRIGTKIPAVLPHRITKDNELITVLRSSASKFKRVYITTHFNHPREITSESKKAIDLLKNALVTVSNQSVLLKGVNDNPETIADLNTKLIKIGVIPYYLFQCRPVKRVKKHFQVPLYRGYEIVEKAKSMLDGYSKRFRYVMSHKTGKIEILGIMDGYIYLKYHQAKNPENQGKLFRRRINKEDGWLDDLSH